MSPESSTPESPDPTIHLEEPDQLETTTDAGHPAPLATDREAAAAGPPDLPEPSAWAARGVRMRTVVLGLVLLAVSATTLLRVLTDIHVDDSLVVLILLVVAGVLLLGGGVASAAREARAGRARR